jgi:hypothetical protein
MNEKCEVITNSVEIIEKDTIEEEDQAYQELLQDIVNIAGNEKRRNQLFGIFVNKNIFDGWVKQPSPCCAAASVAGAWNSLANINRNHGSALNYLNILDVYKDLFLALIHRKVSSFERLLGAPFLPLLIILEEELLLAGKIIGGKKKDSANKASIFRVFSSLFLMYLDN